MDFIYGVRTGFEGLPKASYISLRRLFVCCIILYNPLYFVYVLKNREDRLYIGFTTDLERRVRQHQEDKGGWTSKRGPWELVHYETFSDRPEAMRRERNLKRGKTNQELRMRFTKAAR